jgi:AcrR family transcriptional regulator
MKEDRRIERTKLTLAEALRQLIVEKGYENISVQEIIDKANIGRSTFYTHYENKEQLLLGNINFQRELIDTPHDDEENYPMGINLTYLFDHSREHRALGEHLSYEGRQLVRDFFTDVCSAKIIEHHRAGLSYEERQRRLFIYRAEAAAAAIVAMLFKWLEAGADTPVEDMVGQAREILENVIPSPRKR